MYGEIGNSLTPKTRSNEKAGPGAWSSPRWTGKYIVFARYTCVLWGTLLLVHACVRIYKAPRGGLGLVGRYGEVNSVDLGKFKRCVHRSSRSLLLVGHCCPGAARLGLYHRPRAVARMVAAADPEISRPHRSDTELD